MVKFKQLLKRQISLYLLRLSPFFDEKWYREQTGISDKTNAAAHYLDGGWKSNDPSLRFRQEPYLEANQDVREARVCPLAHYLLNGRWQHRLLYPGMIENHYHRYTLPRAVNRCFFEILNYRRITRNQSARILAIVHIYYEESTGEILEYLKNLRPYAWDLVVTTTEDRNTELIRRAVLRFREDAEFRILPNSGFDILPYLEVLDGRNLSDYDLVIKLQSKRCFSRKGDLADETLFRGREWFTTLFRAVIGARLIHRNIDRLLHNEQVSLIAAQSLLWTDTLRKQQITNKRLAPFGLSLPENYTFVAGSCFVMKALRVQSAQELGVSLGDFGAPVRGAFTLAHALERYLTGNIPDREKLGNPVCRISRWISKICLHRRKRKNVALFQALRQDVQPFSETYSSNQEKPLTIAFAVTETGPNAVAGDLFTAKELAAALEKKGVRCLFVSQQEPDSAWYHLNPEVDILVSMLQHYDPQNIRNEAPHLRVIGWARNWFDAWAESPWIDEYDLLLASSSTACAQLKEKLHRPVYLLPIATNPERFHPLSNDSCKQEESEEERTRFVCDYCFTGNHFGVPREIEEELDPEALPYRLNIYGNGWDKDERFAPWSRGHVPYEDMPLVYNHTRVVLDDATPSTKETGAMNSRVYDAIAAGCLVLTNNEVGAKETFEGLLPTFHDKLSLRNALELYLGNEPLRQKKVQELRQFVLEKHTYALRAERLLKILEEHPAVRRNYSYNWTTSPRST